MFEDEHLYRDEDLGLAKLARRVELTPHQLSELLNVRFGEGHPRRRGSVGRVDNVPGVTLGYPPLQ